MKHALAILLLLCGCTPADDLAVKAGTLPDHFADIRKMVPLGQTAPETDARNPAATPKATLQEYSARLRRGEMVIHDGPLVLGHHGATLRGHSRGDSVLIVRGSGLAAVHVNSCVDTTIADVTIAAEGTWDYGLLLDRREKQRAAHGARVRDVAITGAFPRAVVGDWGAEVYTLDGCTFTQQKNKAASVFETRGLVDGEIWSNASKRIIGCSLDAQAVVECVVRVGTCTHNVAFRDCEISANVRGIDAMFAVGESVPGDNTQAVRNWNVVGRLIIEGGHFEGRGCQHFMRRNGKTLLRDLTLRDFDTQHRASSPWAGFDAPPAVQGVWFRKVAG